ncbi:hypothetical protein HanRHA438_Chr11g0524091 [Helianthus annuus]|uniref:Uncharacterized protein n=1 Tax=Helianthus annuus TaxID=4232 RepID=A0A9K3GXK4_HELAN|nr:hypothetical protein HanXRQr2_Chr17g0809451 [Helianthus annuus]KAF5758698.1 hypothetical protein HanXRQr2_Chr16g0732281 [Helianthus annuus]KAF5783783.1 hypothetical protein HanXRQr2_Chr11g0511841 [Helianthus annuus]KAJ0511297.1 hypothetical protein HanIR_Chr11g0550351 [Helianthus annuus]KAJ0519023.1 hypothetical protein HanHA89_Chr11g0443951 [Helianthus annuus]
MTLRPPSIGEDVETFHDGGSSPSAGANDDGGGGTEGFSDSKSQGSYHKI